MVHGELRYEKRDKSVGKEKRRKSEASNMTQGKDKFEKGRQSGEKKVNSKQNALMSKKMKSGDPNKAQVEQKFKKTDQNAGKDIMSKQKALIDELNQTLVQQKFENGDQNSEKSITSHHKSLMSKEIKTDASMAQVEQRFEKGDQNTVKEIKSEQSALLPTDIESDDPSMAQEEQKFEKGDHYANKEITSEHQALVPKEIKADDPNMTEVEQKFEKGAENNEEHKALVPKEIKSGELGKTVKFTNDMDKEEAREKKEPFRKVKSEESVKETDDKTKNERCELKTSLDHQKLEGIVKTLPPTDETIKGDTCMELLQYDHRQDSPGDNPTSARIERYRVPTVQRQIKAVRYRTKQTKLRNSTFGSEALFKLHVKKFFHSVVDKSESESEFLGDKMSAATVKTDSNTEEREKVVSIKTIHGRGITMKVIHEVVKNPTDEQEADDIALTSKSGSIKHRSGKLTSGLRKSVRDMFGCFTGQNQQEE